MKIKTRPQLFIDTTPLKENEELALKIYEETDKYSITPTTFKARKILSDKNLDQVTVQYKQYREVLNQKLQTAKKLLDESNQIINLAVKSQVFSIGEGDGLKNTNPISNLLQTKVNELNNQIIKVELYEQNIESVIYTKMYEDIYENMEGNAVIRYGINSLESIKIAASYNEELRKLDLIKIQGSQTGSKKSGKSNKEEQSDILLHPLEVKIVQSAITSLQLGKQKTALIDIFARDDKEQIQFDTKTKLPETHTVVLYKNTTSEYIVIDPSNSSFSSHLACKSNNNLIGDSIKIIASEKELKIYSPASKDNIGPNPNQYRDCIDIAVKLAFGLNQIDTIDIKDLTNLESIQEITNNTHIDKYIPSLPDEFSLRIKQASETKIVKHISSLLKYIDKQLKSFSIYPKEGSKELAEKMQESYLLEKLYQVSNLENDHYQSGIEILGDFKESNEGQFIEFIKSV